MPPLPVIFSPQAKSHLDALERYLAKRFHPGSAAKYVQRLAERCIAIGSAPQQGTRREDIRRGAKTVGFEHRVTILFALREDRILILGLYYGGKQPPST